MNGKASCLICSESVAVCKEYSITRHYNSKHKAKYRSCVGALKREKVVTLIKAGGEGGLRHNRMPSENNPLLVPVHCRQAVVLLTCWLKKVNLLPTRN
jgi:hypothetical protein